MAKRRGGLPKSELEIARIVWELKEATVRQVLEALPQERELDFWTVQTYLRRLEAKGYLRKHKEGRNNVYSPAVRPKHVVSAAIDEFVERLFDGETLPLMQHLIQDQGLTEEQIDQLQESLDALKAKRQEDRADD